MAKNDYVSGAQKTVHYDWEKPIYYNGYSYPTTDMEIVDENGYSLGLRPVFIDGIGQRFYKSKEGKIIPITSQYPLDDVIITPSGNYKTTMDRNAEPFRFQNVANTSNVNNTPNVKEEKPEPTAQEQEILRKQSLLKAAGYNVPYEGSWDSQQEEAWDNLITRNKQYDNTLAGTFQGLMDQFKGETTEKIDPFNQGEVKTYDEKNIDLGKTRRSQSDIVKSLEGTYGPILAAIMFPKLFANGLLSGLTTLGGGYMGGKAVDKLSESLTGNDFGTNVAKYTPLSPGLAEWLNPGTYVGGYGGPRVASVADALVTGVTGKSRDFTKPMVRKYLGEPYYNNIRPMGYKNKDSNSTLSKGKQIKNFILDIAKPLFLREDVSKGEFVPKWVKDKNNMSSLEVFRNDAFRLSMGLSPHKELLPDGKFHSLYIDKGDGTYDVDWKYVNYVKDKYTKAREMALDPDHEFPRKIKYIQGDASKGTVVANDKITGNGGFSSYTFDTNPSNLQIINKADYPRVPPEDLPDFMTKGDVTFTDKWDVQPFSDWRSLFPSLTQAATKVESKNIPFLSKMSHNLKYMEMVDALGSKPFIQKTKLPNQKIWWYKDNKHKH